MSNPHSDSLPPGPTTAKPSIPTTRGPGHRGPTPPPTEQQTAKPATPAKRVPKYRYHKARDCAVVTVAGRDHYLGPYDSAASREQYHRLVAEHLAARTPPPPEPADAPLSVAELIARYWRFAKGYYVKAGEPTSECDAIKLALRFARDLYGLTPAAEFTPKKLVAVREAMVGHDIVRVVRVVDPVTGGVTEVRKVLRRGMARTCVNKLVGRVRRMYAWAVEEELVGVEVHAALLRVGGLRRGKTAAREAGHVRPAADADVAAVLPLLPPAVRAMAEVQRLCGGRPQDVVQLRPADVDRSGPVWEYRPPRHKTEHHGRDGDGGGRDRVVFLGPQAQAVLGPFLAGRAAGDYLFCPRRSEAARHALRKEKRASPVTPGQAARGPESRAAGSPCGHYSVASYRRAVRRACLRAGVPVWCPNRLRHARLTEVRKLYGLEASRVVGGHREVGVTQMYAEQDHDLARKVMAAVG